MLCAAEEQGGKGRSVVETKKGHQVEGGCQSLVEEQQWGWNHLGLGFEMRVVGV